MEAVCEICGGAGLRLVKRLVERRDGSHDEVTVASECRCRIERRAERRIASAKLPERHLQCTFDSYSTEFASADPSIARALLMARRFVEEYPAGTHRMGLMFVGKPGLGKTHLATAVLQGLIQQRSVQGLFVDYRDLLKEVQNSYDPRVAATELSILKPVFDAEVLVIDDLGASKPTEWVYDTITHILNARYKQQLTTIITTNYPNLEESDRTQGVSAPNGEKLSYNRTLGDMVGNRVLSRLQEMCVVIEMRGSDYRNIAKRADFRSQSTPIYIAPQSSDVAPTVSERPLVAVEPSTEPPVSTRDMMRGFGALAAGRLSSSRVDEGDDLNAAERNLLALLSSRDHSDVFTPLQPGVYEFTGRGYTMNVTQAFVDAWTELPPPLSDEIVAAGGFGPEENIDG